MIPVFATGDNYIGDNYNDNLYDDKNFEPVSVGMDLSVEAKDEIQLKLELAQESDDLVFEVEAMREENVKHFHLGDGSFQAVSYGSAVHRKDADGKWQDIDNTLALQNVKGTNRYSAPNSRVTFADAFSASSKIMTLRESGYSVSFSLITNEKTNNALAKVSNHEARSSQLDLNDATTKLDSLKAIDNKTSIKYENILNSIDLEYVLISNNIKENIIVKEALDNYSFTFTLEVEGLVAKLNEYGIINLYDTKSGKEVYTIPAPFMFDAKNELSYDVFYTLKEQSSGKYELTVTADEKWINADDRAFPVTIDPTINTTTAVWDTTVTSINKNTGYGTLQIITLNQQSTGLIYIDMPTLPSGSTISSAYLNAAYYVTGGSSGYVTIGAYQMNGRWTEGTSGSYPAPHPPITGNTPNATSTGSTWNSLNSAYGSSLGISSLLSTVNAVASPSVTRNNPAWISFNVTSAVGSWYSGTVNNGIALKNLGGTLSTAAIIAWEAYNEYSAYYTITYEVPVASGVYALNLAGTSRYMQSISSSEGYYASQTTHSSPPLGASTRSSMFKVIAVGNNEYIIRSMTNSELVMRPYYSGTPGVITSAPIPKDSDVPSAYKWKITQASDGYYYISNVNGSTTYYMYMPSSGSIRLTTNINTSGTKWGLPKYTGTDINGVEWTSFNSSFIVGETFTYSAYMYSSVIGRNGPVEYSVSDDTVASIDKYTGYFTATKPGVIKVRVTYPGAPWYWYVNVTISSGTLVTSVPLSGNISVAYETKTYKFIPSTSGTYQFFTNGSTDTFGRLYSSDFTQLTSNDDGGESLNFLMSYHLYQGTTYYVEVSCYGTKTGAYVLYASQSVNDKFSKQISSTEINSSTINSILEGDAEYNSASFFERLLHTKRITDVKLALYGTIKMLKLTTGLDDACDMLSNFLDNEGTTITDFPVKSMLQYIQNNTTIVSVKNESTTQNQAVNASLVSHINDILIASETFAINGLPQTFTLKNEYYEYSDPIVSSKGYGNNYWLALGGYRVWTKTTVTKSNNSYTATITYGMKDYYDWHPTTETSELYDLFGIASSTLWEMHYYGFAKNFHNSGTATITVTWTDGQRVGSGANYTIS